MYFKWYLSKSKKKKQNKQTEKIPRISLKRGCVEETDPQSFLIKTIPSLRINLIIVCKYHVFKCKLKYKVNIDLCPL